MGEPEPPRSLIDDELIRARIRELREERPPPSPWARLSGHPLTAILFGFLLTWLVGTLLTGRIEERRRATALAAEEARSRHEAAAERLRVRDEASARAIADYARLLSEQQIRAAMLLSALERGSRIGEARERKQAYDGALARWRADLQPTLLSIRASLGRPGYNRLAVVAESRLVGLYAELDSALMRAYDAREAGGALPDLAPARRLLVAAGECAEAVADGLYDLVQPVAAEGDTLESGIGISVATVQLMEAHCEG